MTEMNENTQNRVQTMTEVARSSVQTWECDQMGHMNVQFYMEKATQGLAALGVKLGLGRDFSARHGARLMARDHHVRFLREQRPGAPFFWRAGVLDVTETEMRVYSEMVNPTNGEIAASVTALVELRGENDRLPRKLPDSAIAQARLLMIDMPAHGAPRGLEITPPRAAPMLADAEAMGMVAAYMGEVQETMCDGQGYLLTRHYMGIVSDAISNLLAATHGEDRSQSVGGNKTGGAALEYRFIYRRYPKVGDVCVLRSGLKAVSSKTYIWAHWLFDYESGACLATAEAVAIALDLTTRKAMAIPDDMRAELERLVIPGLGV